MNSFLESEITYIKSSRCYRLFLSFELHDWRWPKVFTYYLIPSFNRHPFSKLLLLEQIDGQLSYEFDMTPESTMLSHLIRDHTNFKAIPTPSVRQNLTTLHKRREPGSLLVFYLRYTSWSLREHQSNTRDALLISFLGWV